MGVQVKKEISEAIDEFIKQLNNLKQSLQTGDVIQTPNFGYAIEMLKKGEKVTRKAWDINLMLRCELHSNSISLKKTYQKIILLEDHKNNTQTIYYPTVIDLFADDWEKANTL